MSKKTSKTKAPDTLAKTGKKSAAELSEAELNEVQGGVYVVPFRPVPRQP